MELKQIVEDYSVSAQLEPADMQRLSEQGFETVICNRPDAEVPDHLSARAMQDAAEAAGLAFVFNPIIGGALTQDNIDEQADAIEAATGPVAAYCASGNRSTVVWSFVMAGRLPVDQIITAGEAQGYAISQLRPHLEQIALKQS